MPWTCAARPQIRTGDCAETSSVHRAANRKVAFTSEAISWSHGSISSREGCSPLARESAGRFRQSPHPLSFPSATNPPEKLEQQDRRRRRGGQCRRGPQQCDAVGQNGLHVIANRCDRLGNSARGRLRGCRNHVVPFADGDRPFRQVGVAVKNRCPEHRIASTLSGRYF